MSEAKTFVEYPFDRSRSFYFPRTRDRLIRYRHLIRFGLMSGAMVADLLIIVAAGMLGATLRQGAIDSDNLVQSIGVLAPTYVLAAIALGTYRMATLRSLPRSLSTTIAALVIAVAFGMCAAFALQVGARFSRLETGYTILFAFGMITIARSFGVLLIRRLLRFAVDPTVVVFTDGTISQRRTGRTSVRSVVNVRASGMEVSLADPAFLNRVAGIVRDADRVVIAVEDVEQRRKWAEAMRVSGFDAEILADLGDIEPLAISRWQGRPTLVISRGPLNLGERMVKRAFDLGVTLLLLPIFGPIIALFAVLVKLESPGPAFFVQDRVGRNNRTYRCFKLRTMRNDMLDMSGNVSAGRSDARITRLGGLMRKTSIDELPQLFNVVMGDMSLVGPRPHALGSRAEGALFWELVPDYWSRHAMKPGVTGLAQVRGLRGATHCRSDIEDRVAADLEYINGWSIWQDLKILVQTIAVTVHRNAY
ncbi:MAG TPA: exopolysaccharide biosynthesis polyprenyl glycosylphosphotransferase [Xanthobacteraceae bacterium]|nr:exopolysaccharide biosynthesis polyprenyl glycosylphosphotransferase [Xanthobacteraceae bacterium]